MIINDVKLVIEDMGFTLKYVSDSDEYLIYYDEHLVFKSAMPIKELSTSLIYKNGFVPLQDVELVPSNVCHKALVILSQWDGY